MSRRSSDCISRRWVRNCTSSTSKQIDVDESSAVGLALPRRDSGVKRLDELVQGEILDRQGWVDRPGRVPDAHEQVGLPQAGTSIDEERVVDGAG